MWRSSHVPRSPEVPLGRQWLPRTGAPGANPADARPARPGPIPATTLPTVERGTGLPTGARATTATTTRTRVVAGAALVAMAGIGLATALPAWADTSPTLRESNVLAATANDLGTGHCGVPQRSDQDVWVFMWPGGSAGSLLHLTVRFDTDGDDQGDTSRTESDAVNVGNANTLRYAVTTPAGWLLIDGTSQITGTSTQNQFRLASVCAGQASAPPTTGPSPSHATSRPAGSPPGAPVSGAPVSASASPSATPTPGASTPPVSASAAPAEGLGLAGGSGPGGGTSTRTVAQSHDTQLAAARHPVTPFVAAGLVIVAVSSAVVGLRRRRAEAWAGNAGAIGAGQRRRAGPAHAPRHRRH